MIFLDMLTTNVTPAACQHNRLMIAADFFSGKAYDFLFISSEITAKIRTTELVVKRSCA